jgi:hypothetical protein
MGRAPLLLAGSLVAGPIACGPSHEAPASIVDNGALVRCFAASYGHGDGSAEVARCEEAHYGSAWRREPARSAEPPSGEAALQGRLDPVLVQASIEARKDRMRACYREGVKRDPKLHGELRVRFTIVETGRAVRVEDAGSTLRAPRVVSCMLAEFSTLRFPRPEGGFVTVVYPMLFSGGDTYR